MINKKVININIKAREKYIKLNNITISGKEYTFAYDLYVSNYGNIYKIIDGKKVFAKNVFDESKGYFVVNLKMYNENKKYNKNILVHRLVALCFIKNPNNYNIINHIDGNKKNNYYKNLEWCNTKMNMTHASKHGLCNPVYGEKHYISKLNNKMALYIWNLYSQGYKTNDIYNIITNKGIDISKSSLKQIKHKRTWKHVINCNK